MIKKIAKNIMERFGLDIRKIDQSFFSLDKNFKEIYEFCRPFTMTSIERMYALYKATEYIVKSNIDGALVECGVWKGGSAMLVAMTLLKFGSTNKKIYLYDTYKGMTEPSESDVDITGKKAQDFFDKTKKGTGSDWCLSSLEEVKMNMLSTNYPKNNLVFIEGKVENTIPGQMPNKISLLRLDTDWFDSTYHEMQHLYPILEKGGVLILDDYGHWQGAKKAVDKYLEESGNNILLNIIDSSSRIGVRY